MKILLDTTPRGLKMSNSTFKWSYAITACLTIKLHNSLPREKY